MTDAADALFAALDANQAITLTGDASQGYGVEVEGEATKPSPSPSVAATPGATGTASPGVSGAPADPAEARVELPDSIAGSTAVDITCTQPQR